VGEGEFRGVPHLPRDSASRVLRHHLHGHHREGKGKGHIFTSLILSHSQLTPNSDTATQRTVTPLTAPSLACLTHCMTRTLSSKSSTAHTRVRTEAQFNLYREPSARYSSRYNNLILIPQLHLHFYNLPTQQRLLPSPKSWTAHRTQPPQHHAFLSLYNVYAFARYPGFQKFVVWKLAGEWSMLDTMQTRILRTIA
jgi:hypothetical protein